MATRSSTLAWEIPWTKEPGGLQSEGSQRVRHSWAWTQVCNHTSFSSVQFSHSVVSDSLRPHESQHARPPCPSPTPEFTQTHVHWVGDAIQPSHPLSSPSPPASNPSQHQSLFQWVDSSRETVAKVLEFQLHSFSFIIPSQEHPGLISFSRELQIKITMTYNYTSLRMAKIWNNCQHQMLVSNKNAYLLLVEMQNGMADVGDRWAAG